MQSDHEQHVRRLFDGAMDLPPDRRPEYLKKHCGDDADLRRRLDAMLAAVDGGFLADATRSVIAAAHLPLREGPGAHIGPYKLLQLIGEGGFGSVFMAEQERPVRRKVALKVIKLGMDTRQVIARFEAERQALAMMDHPHIARVLDAGATESGRPYFVMELVKGVPITEYCDSNNLPARERLELFIPVCQAVQHAHHKGVIHRDIKPGNILVTMHDGKPVPKVIDFGIAKATDARLTEMTLFTEHRQMIGTPAYMSPEQAEMSGLDVDTRTDVYSLGVLLYELLTGTTPFPSEDLLKAGYAEIQRIIREVEPPKPSTRVSTLGESLTTVAGRRKTDGVRLGVLLRGDLDWIVMRCLEKDRTRRYDTPTSLAEDVRRHLEGEAVVAAPPSTAYRLRKFVRRRKGAFAAGAAVMTVLLMGIAGTTWQWARAARELRRSQLNQAAMVVGDPGGSSWDMDEWGAFQARRAYLGCLDPSTVSAAVRMSDKLLTAPFTDALWSSRCTNFVDEYYRSGGRPTWQMLLLERRIAMWLAFHRNIVEAQTRLKFLSQHVMAVVQADGWNESGDFIDCTQWSPQFIDGPVATTQYPNKDDDGSALSAYFGGMSQSDIRSYISQQAAWGAREFYSNELSTGSEVWLPMTELAHEYAPQDSTSQIALGLARFRLGRHEEALKRMDLARGLAHNSGMAEDPAIQAVVAMSHFKLNHPAEARAALAQLRALMSDPANADTWAKDEDAKSLLAEAEALIDPPIPPKP